MTGELIASGPAAPCAPGTPAGPCEPVSPAGPAAPVAPIAPAGLIPGDRCRPLGAAGPGVLEHEHVRSVLLRNNDLWAAYIGNHGPSGRKRSAAASLSEALPEPDTGPAQGPAATAAGPCDLRSYSGGRRG